MAVTPVGVELVAEGTASFLSSLRTAEGGLGNFTAALGGLSGNLVGVATQSSTLGTALAVGLGNAMYDVGKSILGIGSDALQTVAKFERSTQSITAMFAVEMMRGTEVAKITKGLTVLSEKEEKALRDKTLQYPILKEAVAVASESLKKLGDQTGENTVQYEASHAKLQIAVNKMHELGVEIDTLAAKAGKEFSSSKMVSAGDAITDVKEAFRQAQGPANEMIDSMTRLALKSPFKREDTIGTLKMAKGFGMTLAESGKLTESLTKFATVTGRSGDHISRLAYAMGEMKSSGKVMMRQVRQMNLAGISVADMGEAFGITATEMQQKIHTGNVSFNEFSTNLTKFVDDKYGVAFEQIANSFVGLNNAVEDIKELGLAAIFEGPLKLYKPLLEAFVHPFTSGTLLESIRGFSIGLTKSLIPMFETIAGQLTAVFGRFEIFASLIGGKGAIKIDKQEIALKDHQKTIDGLGTSMGNLQKNGITMSDSFAALTTSSARVGASVTLVTDEFKKNNDVLKMLDTTNASMAKDNAKYGQEMQRLAKAGQTNSVEYKALNSLVAENKELIGKNKIQTVELTTANLELTKEQKALQVQYGILGSKMDASKKKGEDQSQMYKDLVAEMAAEEKVMGTSSAHYKEMAADLKIMEDNTKQYTTEIGQLVVADKVMGTMQEQLKTLNDENKTMPWADAFLKANADIMPVGSSLHTIFDTIFQIMKKVFDLFKSGSEKDLGKTAAGAFSWFETLLGKVAAALKFVLDNFELIITVLKNVAIALGTLFAIGQTIGIIKKVITIVTLMLNPINFLIAAVAIFTVAWQKNWGGIHDKMAPTIKKITDKLHEITDWFKGVGPTVEAGLEPAASKFDAFREAIVGMVQKIEAVFKPLKDTFLNAFKGLFSQESIGLDKAQESVQAFLRQIGVVPDEAVKIGFALKDKLTEWQKYFNFPELLAGFDTKNPAFQTLKTDLGGLFQVAFTGNQGEAVVQSFVDKVKAGILTVFGDGADATGFAAAIGNLITTAIVDAGGYMDTFKAKLIEMKDTMIEVTKYVWEHRDAFVHYGIILGKVLLVMYLFNAANKLFGLTTLAPIAVTAVKALWGMGAALVGFASTLFGTLTGMGTASTVAVGTFVEGMGTMTIGAGGALAGVGTMIMAFLTGLTPVGWAIMGVIGLFLVLALFNMEDLAFKIMNVFLTLFKEIGDIAIAFVSVFGGIFNRIYVNIIGPLWEGSIKPTLADIAEAFGFVMDAVSLLMQVIGWLIEQIVTYLGPPIETLALIIFGYLLGKLALLWVAVSGVIRIIYALIKMIVRAITNSAGFIIMIDNLKKAWQFLKDWILGPLGSMFDWLNNKIYEGIGWLGTWQDAINKVIDALGDLFTAKTKSEILKDTKQFIQVRDTGKNSFKMVANPEYAALAKIIDDENAKEFQKTSERITSENRFTAIFQASKVTKPADGGGTDILGSLLGGNTGGLAGLLAGLGTGKKEPGDEALEGPAPGVPGVSDGTAGGGKTSYILSPLMNDEQREKATRARERNAQLDLERNRAASLTAWASLGKPAAAAKLVTYNLTNIEGAYVSASNRTKYATGQRQGDLFRQRALAEQVTQAGGIP